MPAAITFCLAAACYIAVLAAAAGAGPSAMLPWATAPMWLLIATLVLFGGARGWMPRWAALAFCMVVPVSGWVAWQCAALAGSGASAPEWALPVLAALPVPLVLYAFWAHFPWLHRALPPTPVGLAALVAVMALATVPYAAERVGSPVAERPPPARGPSPSAAPVAPIVGGGPAAIGAAAPGTGTPGTGTPGTGTPGTGTPRADSPAANPSSTSPSSAAPRRLADRVADLTPDSPLSAYVPFFIAGGAARQEALARARLLDTRQADAEALVARDAGLDPAVADLSQLDLVASPALCQSFAEHLRQEAQQDRGRDGFYVVSDRIEPQLENMNWLAGARCDLGVGLRAAQETALSYPESPERERFVDAIGALMRAGPTEQPGNPALCLGDTAAPVTDRIAGCTAIVRGGRAGFGKLRATLVSRGTLFYSVADYRAAVADYGAALRLPPEDPRVMVNLGNAEEAAGDHEAALRSYDKAISIDPDSALAFNNRGAAQEAHGDHARAVIDLDVAIKLDPTYATALANRGRARYFLGNFAAAAADFTAALKLRPGDARALLWRQLAARRGRLPVAADLRADAAALDHAVWPWPVVSVFLGDRDIPSGEQAALNADATIQARQSCDADFYFGELRLIDAAVPEARALLAQAIRTCPATSIEAQAAAAEAVRLGNSIKSP